MLKPYPLRLPTAATVCTVSLLLLSRYVLSDDTKVALTDYYDAVHTLCEAQQNFAKSTQVLEKKIEDKSVFLDIIKQVQLPAVKVEIRTVEEMERMEGKTYRQLTLMCHLPNFKRINPNAKEQTRTMAAYMYCVLYEQITGVRASQTGCATDFQCPDSPPIMQGLSVPIACVGSGDPVRVLRLYTTNTLDILCKVYLYLLHA